VQESSATWRVPYQFTSKEMDSETGLYYFGARYYDPRTSVWQSADSILGKYLDGERGIGGVFNPRNLGMYGYAGSNPIILVDPDGNASIMLDPGHGGDQPGTTANPAFKEKDITQKMSSWVGLFLTLRGHNVSYTRTGDETMGLRARAEKANEAQVDAFVSLHVDSHKGGSRISTHFDQKANGSSKSSQVDFSSALMQALKESAPEGTKVKSWGEPLGVLRPLDSSTKGSLIEMGNAQNPSDSGRLGSITGRIGLAWDISGAIDKAVGGSGTKPSDSWPRFYEGP
jgi:RHS repeat-associated protein